MPVSCVRGRLDASSGAVGDEAAEIAPHSTALSNLRASARAHFIEPLPGGPSQACPPSTYPGRTANECRGAAPNGGQDPLRHASPPRPTTSKSSRREIPQRHGLRKSRRLAKTSSGLLGPQPLERRRTSAPRTRLFCNSQSAGAAQTLRAVRKSKLVDLTYMTFSCGAGSPNPQHTKAGAGPVRCNGSLGRASISHEGPGV